jgi:ribosomal protein L18E
MADNLFTDLAKVIDQVGKDKGIDKEVIVEALNFYNDLVEKLKSSKISINQLKQMLVGFKADNIKKLLQIH